MARTCYRTLQVDGSSEFDELAGDILNAFGFDFEHLYEFRTKLRNVEENITYSLGEDYCPYDFWEDSAEDTEETNSSDKTENCTEEIEYEDPDPDFGEYDIHRPLTHQILKREQSFIFIMIFVMTGILLFMFQKQKKINHYLNIQSVSKVLER